MIAVFASNDYGFYCVKPKYTRFLGVFIGLADNSNGLQYASARSDHHNFAAGIEADGWVRNAKAAASVASHSSLSPQTFRRIAASRERGEQGGALIDTPTIDP